MLLLEAENLAGELVNTASVGAVVASVHRPCLLLKLAVVEATLLLLGALGGERTYRVQARLANLLSGQITLTLNRVQVARPWLIIVVAEISQNKLELIFVDQV
jgi:hypothetical protein